MRKLNTLYLALSLGLSVVACSGLNEESIQPKNDFPDNSEKGYFASIDSPVEGFLSDALPSTKAITTDFTFKFVEGDKLKVYPAPPGNTVLTYTLVPKEDTHHADFAASQVKMEDGMWYAVYPPANDQFEATAIGLPYVGQVQSANNNSDHLAKYDYNWASAEITDNRGNFGLAHLGSWLKITLKSSINKQMTFKKIDVYAAEGIAPEIKLDALTGETTSTRDNSMSLSITLGGIDGIKIESKGSLVVYLAIPSGEYTNLTIKTSGTYKQGQDNKTANYGFVHQSKTELKPGKYYTATLTENSNPDVPGPIEPAFLKLTSFGSYSDTDTDEPEEEFLFVKNSDQISYGTASSARTCKIFNVEGNQFTIFTIGSNALTVGESYTVSLASNVSGRSGNSTFKAVKKTDSCIWLEDQTNHTGYILPIE